MTTLDSRLLKAIQEERNTSEPNCISFSKRLEQWRHLCLSADGRSAIGAPRARAEMLSRMMNAQIFPHWQRCRFPISPPIIACFSFGPRQSCSSLARVRANSGMGLRVQDGRFDLVKCNSAAKQAVDYFTGLGSPCNARQSLRMLNCYATKAAPQSQRR